MARRSGVKVQIARSAGSGENGKIKRLPWKGKKRKGKKRGREGQRKYPGKKKRRRKMGWDGRRISGRKWIGKKDTRWGIRKMGVSGKIQALERAEGNEMENEEHRVRFGMQSEDREKSLNKEGKKRGRRKTLADADATTEEMQSMSQGEAAVWGYIDTMGWRWRGGRYFQCYSGSADSDELGKRGVVEIGGEQSIRVSVSVSVRVDH